MEYLRLPSVPTTEPAVEPYSLAEAKAYLRIDDDEQNAGILTSILAARQDVEAETRRQLITAKWTGNLDAFPAAGIIWLPLPPLIGITSISYVDTNGDPQDLATSVYDVDANSEPGRITLAFNQSWPSTRAEANAVTIVFTAGFGGAAVNVPAVYKQAISMLLEHWYDPTAGVKFKAIADLPEGIRRILSKVRIPRGR